MHIQNNRRRKKLKKRIINQKQSSNFFIEKSFEHKILTEKFGLVKSDRMNESTE